MLENEIVFHSQRRFLQSTEEQKSAHISNFKLSNANPPMTLNIAFVEQDLSLRRRGQQGKKEGNRMMIMMNFILDAYNNGGRSRFACRTVSKLGSRTKLKYSIERVGGGSRRNHQQQLHSISSACSNCYNALYALWFQSEAVSCRV